MKFGVNLRGKKTGAELYVLLIQALSLLPSIYIYILSGYYGLMRDGGLPLTVFQVGLASLPRWEVLLISHIYRWTASEIAVFFALMVSALAFGLLIGRLLKGNHRTARITRMVLIGLIGGELIFRLLPLWFNHVFGLPVTIIGLVIRVTSLALIALDLLADRKVVASTAGESA